MIWMEKIIGKHPVIPNKVIPVTQLLEIMGLKKQNGIGNKLLQMSKKK